TTQHNAALVEETNAAIEQTENQATELDKIVDVFVTDGEARVVAANQGGSARAPSAKPSGIKQLQSKVSSAAKSMFGRGSEAVAVDEEWEEF
ncbi:methyl-accepting chemotaxis protein, partial [Maritalea sp. P4.10X]|nr:methyl-accepting chemotaxis protein [Maritalea mediterranea]